MCTCKSDGALGDNPLLADGALGDNPLLEVHKSKGLHLVVTEVVTVSGGADKGVLMLFSV